MFATTFPPAYVEKTADALPVTTNKVYFYARSPYGYGIRNRGGYPLRFRICGGVIPSRSILLVLVPGPT